MTLIKKAFNVLGVLTVQEIRFETNVPLYFMGKKLGRLSNRKDLFSTQGFDMDFAIKKTIFYLKKYFDDLYQKGIGRQSKPKT